MTNPASLDRRILSYDSTSRQLLYLTVGEGFVASALAVAQAWLLAVVVASVFVDKKTLSDVRGLLIVMLLFALVRAGLIAIGAMLAQRSATHLKNSLRGDVTRRLLDLGPAFVSTERTGELVNTSVEGVEDLDEYITGYQPLRYLAVIVPAFVAVVVFMLDPLSVVVLLLTGPILVLFLALIGSRAKEISDRRFRELSWMSASFLDVLQGLVTLKMFGRSREQVENIRDVSSRYGSTTMQVLRTAFETSLVLELSTTIATALVAVEVSLRLIDGAISFERALAVLIITPEFFFPLRQLAARYHARAAGTAAAERLFAILDTPAPSIPQPTAGVPMRFANVRLEHMSYAYDGGRRPALRDVTFDLGEGETVALVGETGAGKSTVANLLLRFIEPQVGQISVDGAPLASIDPAAWRQCVAWVPQRPYLFHGTIAENILLARTDASIDEVRAAARAAHADDFIDRLPQGYDTMIGERGARLSGGEQQRLALARAFLKDAPLLVLDEPTSHLDRESEAAVREALARLQRGRTVLVIAHRLNLAHSADRIIVLRNGRVVEQGTHASLLAAGLAYPTLVLNYERGAL